MADIWRTESVDMSQTDEYSGAGYANRPVGYDPTAFWDPVTGTWVAGVNLAAIGGGRYLGRFVVIGHNNAGKGVVYYR